MVVSPHYCIEGYRCHEKLYAFLIILRYKSSQWAALLFKVVIASSTPNLISYIMKFLSLPKIGQHIAVQKDTIEDPAFVNAQKVWRL